MTHLHGPVPLTQEIYVQRSFEISLIRDVQAGRWVLFLGPRQHGKTSALLRLQRTLTDNGSAVALVDLQKLPPFEDYAELVVWFATSVANTLGHKVVVSPTNDLASALDQAVPKGNYPIILLVDEASNIKNEDWRNSFYGQLRSISSERAVATADQLASRLVCVFSGTFRPERLVAEANSPFNICQRVDTTDLNEDEITELAERCRLKKPKEVATTIFGIVGGQPFLVQSLLDRLLGAEDEIFALNEEIVGLRTGQSEHITNLFRRVLSDQSLSAIASTVTRTGSAPLEPGDDDQKYLMVLGLLKRDSGQLVFRNSLYAEVASKSPQLLDLGEKLPEKAWIFPVTKNQFAKVSSPELQEIAHTAQLGGVASYRGGSNRLALAGLGTALEAVLIDFLTRQNPSDVAKAAAACKNTPKSFDASDPVGWRLVDLMSGSRALIAAKDLDIPENLREWRNLIHPAVSMKNYKPDDELAPEVIIASGLLTVVLRDLP